MTTDFKTIVEHHEPKETDVFLLGRAIVSSDRVWSGKTFGRGDRWCARCRPHFLAWLKLVAEAVGLGYVRSGIVVSEDKLTFAPENLLELLLLDLLPSKVAACPPNTRMALLAKAWNLGEGLLAEAPWLNVVVASAMANVTSLVDMEGRLFAFSIPVRATCSFCFSGTVCRAYAGPARRGGRVFGRTYAFCRASARVYS